MEPRELRIVETKKAIKDINKAPSEVVYSYQSWAELIETHGLSVLRKFQGYHDEALKGEWKGFRSSRLNKQWRVIYSCDAKGSVQIVTVERVTAHDYRRKK